MDFWTAVVIIIVGGALVSRLPQIIAAFRGQLHMLGSAEDEDGQFYLISGREEVGLLPEFTGDPVAYAVMTSDGVVESFSEEGDAQSLAEELMSTGNQAYVVPAYKKSDGKK